MVGGGAAGLWTALRAAEGGGSVCLISRKPLSQSASFWAQGGLAAALEPGDSPARHAADTIAAGRGLCRPAAVEVLVEEAPGRGARAARARRRLRPRRRTASWRWGSRAATPGAASSTPAAARRGTRSARSWRRWSPPSRGSRCASGPRRRRCGATASAATGVLTEAGPIAAAATVLATGGAAALWRRTTNPRGAIGAGPVLGRGGRGRPRRPRVLPVPPDRAGAAGDPLRRAADHRGGARRGGDAARRLGPALHRRAGPARRGHRGDPRPDGGRRHARRRARPARRSTPPASPTSSSRWPKPGSTRAPSRSRSPPRRTI